MMTDTDRKVGLFHFVVPVLLSMGWAQITPTEEPYAQLDTTPVTVRAAPGDSVTLPCHTVNRTAIPVWEFINWVYMKSGTSIPENLSIDDIVLVTGGRHQITSSSIGEWSLMIDNVTADDEGTYICELGKQMKRVTFEIGGINATEETTATGSPMYDDFGSPLPLMSSTTPQGLSCGVGVRSIPGGFAVFENISPGQCVTELGYATSVFTVTRQHPAEPRFTVTVAGSGWAMLVVPDEGLDAETSSSFTITMGKLNVQTGTSLSKTIAVLVEDVNEFAPVFDQSMYTTYANVSSGGSIGVNLLQVNAKDKDISDRVEYLIAGGNIPETFAIDSTSGHISVQPNAQLSEPIYNLTVEASDGVKSAFATVLIHTGSPRMTESTCEAVEDSYDIERSRTSASTRVRLETACPPGHTGEVYRRCDENAVWQETVYNCTADTLKKLRQAIQEQSTNVTSVLKTLVSFTAANNASALTNLAGNVQATTDILGDIVDRVDSAESVADNVVEDFLEIADNLMEENTTASWRSIVTETKAGVNKVLTSIDKFVEKVAKAGNSSGKTVELAKSNFYVRIGRTQDAAKDITFPDRTSVNVPYWTKHSWNSIVLPVHQSMDNVSYSSIIYKDLREMLPEQLNVNDSESEKMELNSPVISLTLFTEQQSALQKPVTITFQQFEEDFKRPQCVFWNEGSTSWDKKGCSLVSYDADSGVVVCKCNHLTNFAVLMSHAPVTKVHGEILGIISIIGCVVSMLCLVLTFALYLHHWKRVGSGRAFLLLNLCVVLFMAYFVFLLGVDRVTYKTACTAVAVILHFLYLTVFFIMMTKSLFLAKMLLWPMNRTPITKACLLIAYGASTLVVSISMGITKLQGYGTDTTCWLSIQSGLLWAFVGPALFVMVVNAVVVVIVLKIKFSTRAMEKKTNKEKISSGLRNILVLLPIMGITWVFGVFSVNEDTVVFQYLFALCNSLQGLLIFIFHCLQDHKMRKQVNKSVRKTLRKVRPPEYDLAKTKSTSGTHKTLETTLSSPSTSQHDGP